MVFPPQVKFKSPTARRSLCRARLASLINPSSAPLHTNTHTRNVLKIYRSFSVMNLPYSDPRQNFQDFLLEIPNLLSDLLNQSYRLRPRLWLDLFPRTDNQKLLLIQKKNNKTEINISTHVESINQFS